MARTRFGCHSCRNRAGQGARHGHGRRVRAAICRFDGGVRKTDFNAKIVRFNNRIQTRTAGLDEAQPRFGWTNYRKRLQYQTCAVTLHSGKNHLALTLVNGWYKGKLGFMPQPARLFDYGFDTLIFQLPGRFLVDNFCRADGGEHRCGRSVSTAPEAAYLLPGLGANGVVGGLQVVEPVLHSNPSFKCQ